MNSRGSSLVAVILALSLVTVGLTALMKTSAYTIGIRAGSSRRATAMYIADTYLEQLKIRSDSLIVAESPISVDSRGTIDSYGIYSRSLTVDRSIAPNLIKTTVTVEYRWAMGQLRSVQLTTFIYKGEL